MAQYVGQRRAPRHLTRADVGAFLGISQPRVSQLASEGAFGPAIAGRYFDAQIVRRYAEIARKCAVARCKELESRGWVHIESAAAALNVSVENVLEHAGKIAHAGAGRRLVRHKELARLRALLTVQE